MPKEFSLKFKEGENGLWFVTIDSPPSLFLAHRDIERILADLPAIMNHWMRRQSEAVQRNENEPVATD